MWTRRRSQWNVKHNRRLGVEKDPKRKNYKRNVSDISSLTNDIQAMKRSIAELISKRDEAVDETNPKPPRTDAGNAFGGRAFKFKVKSD